MPYSAPSTMTERTPRLGSRASGPPGRVDVAGRGAAAAGCAGAAGRGAAATEEGVAVAPAGAGAAEAPPEALIWSSFVRRPEASQMPPQAAHRSMTACIVWTPPRSIGVPQRGHGRGEAVTPTSGLSSIGPSTVGRRAT